MQNPLIHQCQFIGKTYLDFNQIQISDFVPAFEFWMQETDKRIQDILKQPAGFINTVVALEYADLELKTLNLLFSNLHSAQTSEALENIAEEMMPKITNFYSKITTNSALFQKIQQVYQQEKLTAEDAVLLEETYKNFVRNGALLSEQDKQSFTQIQEEISVLNIKFHQNVLTETNDFELWLDDPKMLVGLPDSAKTMAKEAAKAKNQSEKWLFTLQAPSYLALITYSDLRSLRKQFFLAMNTRACKNDASDNQKIVLKLVELRRKLANLLGYPNYSTYILEDRMAGTPENVKNSEQQLLNHALPLAKEQVKDLEIYAKNLDQIEHLEPWDFAYYAEKLKKEKFNLDQEILRPYFSVDKCLEAMFFVAKKLFSLSFLLQKNAPVYHSEVQVYEVTKNGEHLGVLYIDLFPRASKRAGAWMTIFKEQYHYKNQEQRPHISIVCNFTPATEHEPALLNFTEFSTLFHEFGHALHGLLAQGQYPSLTGTQVKWDFVEFPSQLLENWCYEREILEKFAKHYQTQEVIPQFYIEKIQNMAQFFQAYQFCRQIGLSQLDMAWHSLTEPLEAQDVFDFEKIVLKNTTLLPVTEQKTSVSTSFSHIFSGEYAAGYYSYKWAEMIEADAFAFIQKNGVFNPEIAAKLLIVLQSGGTQAPMSLYKNFRGQDPNPEALLTRSGILKVE